MGDHADETGSELRGRVALVTGASSGIGAATARALARAGARVIVADIDDPGTVAREIGGLSARMDVTDEADWASVMMLARAEAGGLDILVNNAGIAEMKPLMATTLDDWRRVQAVNVEGVFLGCRAAIPLLAERAERWTGGTTIINMSSVGGIVGSPNTTVYCASKGAVRLLSKSLALEVAKHGIRVNSVHPGLTETPLAERALMQFSSAAGVDADEGRRQILAMSPFGRIAQPDNIADGIVFLASARSAFMTGADLVIDGGMTAQ